MIPRWQHAHPWGHKNNYAGRELRQSRPTADKLQRLVTLRRLEGDEGRPVNTFDAIAARRRLFLSGEICEPERSFVDVVFPVDFVSAESLEAANVRSIAAGIRTRVMARLHPERDDNDPYNDEGGEA